MADEQIEETEAAEIEEGDDDEEGDEEGDEYEIDAELRSLEKESIEQSRRLKKVANRMDDQTALAFREIAGVYQMLTDVVSATADAIDEIDDQMAQAGVQPVESFLTDDDATAFYGALVANMKLAREAADAAEGEARRVLEALAETNDGLLKRVVEMSELEEEELQAALEKSALQ